MSIFNKFPKLLGWIVAGLLLVLAIAKYIGFNTDNAVKKLMEKTKKKDATLKEDRSEMNIEDKDLKSKDKEIKDKLDSIEGDKEWHKNRSRF
jgi:hypothetical protein